MRTGRESRARAGASRARERAKARPEVDAVAVALTAQIILCILILLGAQMAKMSDQAAFARIKDGYAGLVGGGEGMSLSDYFAELTGMSGGFFTSVERWVQGLLGNREIPPQPGRPEEGESAPEETGAGGGGGPPLAFSGGLADMLPAPPGNTLAPYFLSSRLALPVEGTVTSPFAFRVHPVRGGIDFHNGVDIAAPAGRRILAALPGLVEEVGEDDIYGKYIRLRHAHNLQTFYAHASEVFVREGMSVNQGERIARVGETGLATGPHLHFAVIVEDLYADPLHALARYIQMVE